MIGRRMVWRLLGAATASVLAVGGTAGLPAASAGPRASAGPTASTLPPTAAAGPLQLQLTGMTPSSVVPENDLVITGIAHNTSRQAIKNVKVSLRLRPQALDGREAIDTWLSGDAPSEYEFSPPGEADLKPLGPGRSERFSITVPAGHLGLSTLSGSFGPRAITLLATKTSDSSLSSDPLAELRSTIVWAPGDQTPRTRLSLLVPITDAKASIRAGQPTEEVAKSLLPGGRLRKIADATVDPALSWAIDPALLASAQRMITNGVAPEPDTEAAGIDDPTAAVPAPTSSATATSGATTSTGLSNADAGAAAKDWLGHISTGLTGRSVLGLPFADPDLTSLLSTKQSLSLLKHSDTLGKTITQDALGSSLDTTVAWPGDGKVTPAALSALQRVGRKAVLLASDNQPPQPSLDYTPNGVSELHTGTKTLTGLLYDEQLSQLVAGAGSTAQSAASIQTLLAQLAAITLEQPDDTRQVLAVTPRTWDPNPVGVQNLMTALHSASWVSLRGMTSLRKAQSPPRAAPSYPQTAVTAQLPPGQITGALALSRGLDAFGQALSDPQPVLEPLREQVASLLSVAWRNDRKQMSSERSQVYDNVTALTGAVTLSVGTKKWLLTAHSAPIPLYVVNDTIYPIKIRVVLHPESGQLSTTPSDLVTLQPHTRTSVLVKARAIAGGDVVVEAKLLSAQGDPLAPSVEFIVRVRPDWESRGMIGAGTVLGFLLVIGLFRSFRRRRRPHVPLESVPDVDDIALERATGSIPIIHVEPVTADSPVTPGK